MIEVSNLTKKYGERKAIDQLHFTIQPGEIVGFLGPNGAGKSTTMKILTGFMPASEGTARILGFDVFKNPIEVKKNIGYLPETPPVYPEMKVIDYLKFSAKIHDISKDHLSQAVEHALQKTNLTHVKNRLIRNLSKGFQQRVGLAQALVHNPKVLILDEPTVGLDPKQIIEIRQLIKGLKGEHTVILSSHILPEVTATCDRIIVINQGKIVAEDSIEQLSSRLQGGSLYQMEVKVHQEEALQAIRTIPGVHSAQRLNDHLWKIEIHSEEKEIRDLILETAFQKGARVLSFSREKVSLEEIFLQLTTQEGNLD